MTLFGANIAGPIIAVAVFYLIHLYFRRIQHSKDHNFVQRIRTELQSIVDCLEPIAVVDEELKFVRVNDKFREWLGKSFNEIIGKSIRDAMTFEAHLIEAQVKKCFEQMEQQRKTEIEVPQIPLMIHGCPKMIRIVFYNINLDSPDLNQEANDRFVLILLQDITSQELAKQKNLDHEFRIREDYFKIQEISRELDLNKSALEMQMAERDEELKIAQSIQQGLLPQGVEVLGAQIWSTYRPISSVGGDYYDVVPLPGGKFGIFIADVAGHGLAAAFVGALTKMALILHAQNCTSPAELMEKLNSSLEQVIHTGHFVTAFYCIYDPATRKLQYSRAGHPAPILARGGGDVLKLETRGLILGAFPSCMAGEDQVELQEGDRLFLFTDGCFERKILGSGHERLKYKNFVDLIEKHKFAQLDRVFEKVENDLVDSVGGLEPHEDDYTFIALEFNPA